MYFLGYKTHADYILELRMAKNQETVKKFLSDLAIKLQPLWAEEKKELLALKEAECKENGWEFNNNLNFWDMRYYCTMIEEKKYSVDKEKLREYFPLEKVTEGLLQIYQQLLGLKFQLVKDADVWHEDVSMVSNRNYELCFKFCIFWKNIFCNEIFKLFCINEAQFNLNNY